MNQNTTAVRHQTKTTRLPDSGPPTAVVFRLCFCLSSGNIFVLGERDTAVEFRFNIRQRFCFRLGTDNLSICVYSLASFLFQFGERQPLCLGCVLGKHLVAA